MAFQFPWTNFHELNLDWFLSKFKQFANNYLGTTATAESVPFGTPPSVTVTGGDLDDDTDIVDPFTFNFKIPAGQPGVQGVPGAPGAPGQDGFSPIATVTKSGDVATITITDAQGTTSATISDGGDGTTTINKQVAGEILAITDAKPRLPLSLVVNIPYQSDGISSFTMRFHKRNMLCLTGTATNAGLTYTPQADGSVNVSGISTGNSRYGYWGATSYQNTNNLYNLPAGTYSFFVWSQNINNYTPFGLHIYKGSSSTKIADTDTNVVSFTTANAEIARVNSQFSSGIDFSSPRTINVFLGVGANLSINDWDAPATTHDELSVNLGQSIYGGTVDLVAGKVTSLYDSAGNLLATPVEFDISVTLPALFEGANTIWTSVVSSSLDMIYEADFPTVFLEDQKRQDMNLAYVESSDIASRNYAVNQYFINSSGVLCRITSAVVADSTLINGTNYTVVTGGLANDLYTLLS